MEFTCPGGSPLGVTLFHVFPPSRVSCTSPSSVPTQIVPGAFSLSAT